MNYNPPESFKSLKEIAGKLLDSMLFVVPAYTMTYETKPFFLKLQYGILLLCTIISGLMVREMTFSDERHSNQLITP